MEPERMEMSQRERDRLKVIQQVEQGQLTQERAGERLRLSARQVRRLLRRVHQEGDGGVLHRLRGRRSNRRVAAAVQQRAVEFLRRPVYAGFGPTLATEHLGLRRIEVSRETVRQWMIAADLWQPRSRKRGAVHVWRERRAAFGELVQWDSSPFAWLEERGPQLQLIAMIDDASSRIGGRFAEHDSTAENLRALQGWLRQYGRPLAFYTDKNSLFVTTRAPAVDEQLRSQRPRTQIGRALQELDIEWIAAHSPQAKGRVENLFGTLQDRLVKELRVAGIRTLEQANDYFQHTFVPWWNQRFARTPRDPHDAHRPLGRAHHLERILSVRVARTVDDDHTVVWEGQRWGVPRDQVCAGLRGARAEVERRLDGSNWLRYQGRYLPLVGCPLATRTTATPFGLRPPGVAVVRAKSQPYKTKCPPPPQHPWRKPWKRTFLLGRKADISTLR